MVAITMPPALSTARWVATIMGVLAERSGTRPPGTRPSLSTSALQIRFTLSWSSR